MAKFAVTTDRGYGRERFVYFLVPAQGTDAHDENEWEGKVKQIKKHFD